MSVIDPNVSIEISTSGIKLIVGYFFNGSVYVLHALESTRAKLINDQIIDASEMTNAIKELVISAEKTLKIRIEKVILGLPSLNLSIQKGNSTTNTTSADSRINDFDGSNLLTMISKQFKDESDKKVVVDVVPYEFEIDDEVKVPFFPKGKASRIIKMVADVEIDDSIMLKSFTKVVNDAGLEIVKIAVNPNAAIKYVSSFTNEPSEFVYIEIQEKLTTLAYAYAGRLLNSESFFFGTDDIIQNLVTRLGVDYNTAKSYIDLYGLSSGPSFPYLTKEGIKLSDIKNCIIDSLQTLVNKIHGFELQIDSTARELFIISGIGGDIIGIDSFLANTFKNSVSLFTPTCFGARSKSYTNCVSLIYYYEWYSIRPSEARPVDLTLTRVDVYPEEIKEGRENKKLTEDTSENGVQNDLFDEEL